MTQKRRTDDTEGGNEPPELAPVEQSLRARVAAMTQDQLEALAVCVSLELERKSENVD